MKCVVRDLLTEAGVSADAQVLVAYSGGADSTCLLHVLRSAGQPVVAAHANHGVAAEADEWQRRCEAICERLGVELEVAQLSLPNKGNLEQTARDARYEALERIRLEKGLDFIAVGHTADDLVETMLFNLTRGSGLAGLCSLRLRRGLVVRPLLGVARAETRDYCQKHGLEFVDDPTNEGTATSRARIRNLVVPQLERINPAVRAAFAKAAKIVEAELESAKSASAEIIAALQIPLNGELGFLTQDWELALDRALLDQLDDAQRQRAIFQAGQIIGIELEYHHVAAIGRDANGAITPEGGDAVVEWSPDRVHYRRLDLPTITPTPLISPVHRSSEPFRWQFVLSRVTKAAPQKKRRTLDVNLNFSALEGDLSIRAIEHGDRMEPLGWPRERKLLEMAAEEGLTRTARALVPIVCDCRGPVWAPGIAVATRAALNQPGEALRLEFGPVEPSSGQNTVTSSGRGA